ncbi:hypothetical protein HGO26_05560 [Shewanella sp. S-1]|uniref:Tetratricopeptide repeat protein n=1 Tax=Shewanella oncorhynchi TaxID=2726434 RepID=A0ABX1KJH9_9GAMM|nr:tetratricopeptide repeat protein [Shewanella oncorhynchi]NLQ22345.1 hypothetical protein [Shewanella oncorhynchi]
MSLLPLLRPYLLCMVIALSTIHTAKVLASTQSVKVPSQEQSWVIQQIMQLQERSIRLEVLLQQQTQTNSNVKETEKEFRQLQLQLMELKEKLAAQADNQLRETKSYDNRISDINSFVNIWGGILSTFGLIITVGAIWLGYSAKNKAVAEAKLEAREFFSSAGALLLQDERTRFDQLRDSFEQQIIELQSKFKSHNNQLVALSYLNKAHEYEKDGKSEVAFSIYNEIFDKFFDDKSPEIQEIVAKALLNKANLHRRMGAMEAAIAVFDDLITRFENVSSVGVQEQVANSLLNKGYIQGELGLIEASINTYNEIEHRFADSSELVISQTVNGARINKANRLAESGRKPEAIAIYDEILKQCAIVSEPEFERLAVITKINRSSIFLEQEKYDEANLGYDEILSKKGTEFVFAEDIAKAQFGKGVVLLKLDIAEQALEHFKSAYMFFKDLTNTDAQEFVALNLFYQINALKILDRMDESSVLVDEIVKRFGKSPVPKLKGQVACTYNTLGFDLLCKGKAELINQNTESAQLIIKKSLDNFNNALSYLQDGKSNGMIAGNRAYALALLGDHQLAESLFAEALRADDFGGKKLYEATLKDFDISPVDEDKLMREIVERQWQLWSTEQTVLADGTPVK